MPSVHSPTELAATKLQVTETEPLFAAVTVTVAPVATPETEIKGVAKYVMLSVADTPRSDEAAKSGCPGTAKATAFELLAENEEIVPAEFVAVALKRMNLPNWAIVARYVVVVAPEIATQPAGSVEPDGPLAEHDNHW